MRVINFAHGDILAIAVLSTVSIAVCLRLPFWVAIVFVKIGCAAFDLGRSRAQLYSSFHLIE
jgi:branched-subunit amino acid ABC-type transport system permease component